MATTILDVLKVDLVLGGVMLLGNAEEIDAFRNVVDADVVVTDKGPFNLGKRFLLGRERIVLDTDVSPSIQSIISKEYPEREGLDRLAEVAVHAIAHTSLLDQQPHSSVYRIDLIYNQDSELPAVKYLADRIFDADLKRYRGWELRGGFCRLVFVDGEKQWGITVEPRFANEETTTVFLSVAQFRDENQLPGSGEINETLQEVWEQAHEFLNRLD